MLVKGKIKAMPWIDKLFDALHLTTPPLDDDILGILEAFRLLTRTVT